MRAGIYARVSTVQQEDGTSLATQEERCRLAAADEGYEVVPEFVWREQWSGAFFDRPCLDQMRLAVTSRLLDAVFVHATDRLARDPLDLLTLMREFSDAVVLLRFVEDPSDSTPEGKLILYVRGYAAQRERANILRRSLAGEAAVAKSGRLPNGTGAGLYGCDYDPALKVRVINQAEAAVVRRMFQWASDGVSIHQIATRLNGNHIPTKKGSLWYQQSVKHLLSNRAFTGVQFYGQRRYRKVKGDKRVVTDRPESEWIRIDGFTPPIITAELFEAVQERLTIRQAMYRKPKNPYLLTGFMRCGKCGTPVVGASRQRGYRCYRCCGTFSMAARPATCDELYMRADRLDSLVWGLVVDALQKPEVLAKELHHHLETGDGHLGEEMVRLRREIADLKGQQRRLLEQRQKDFKDILESQIGPLKGLCDDKERTLRTLKEQQRQRDDAANAEQRITDFCSKLSERLPALDFEGKRSTLAAFGVKALATPVDLSVTVSVDPNVTTIEQTLEYQPAGTPTQFGRAMEELGTRFSTAERLPGAIKSFLEDFESLDVRHQKAQLQAILKSAYVYRDERIELEFRG